MFQLIMKDQERLPKEDTNRRVLFSRAVSGSETLKGVLFGRAVWGADKREETLSKKSTPRTSLALRD